MTEKRNRIEIKRLFVGFWLSVIIFLGLCPTCIVADTTYEVAINKGTATFVVNKYNEGKWKSTIDRELEPDDLVDGKSDKIGAKSKITILNVYEYEWDMFEVLMSIFDVMSYIPEGISINDSLILMPYFSEDLIDELFPDKYEVWEALTVKWFYETEEFDEVPDETKNLIPIFKNPKDFNDLLENYNIWANAINLTMLSLGLKPYRILDGDEFVWQLIVSEIFTIARPFNDYLTNVIKELDCNDIKLKENTLIIEKEGVEDYKVEVIFNEQGILSNIIFKTADNRIIYEIIEDNTEKFILIAIGIILAIGFTGIIYIVICKRKYNN